MNTPRPLTRLLAFAMLIFAYQQSMGAVPVTQVKTRVLFIGNSYTNGIRTILSNMLRKQRLVADVDFLAPGGKTLAWHAGHGALEKIRKGNYDIVVLQEQSQMPAYPGLKEPFIAAVKTLAKVVRERNGKPILLMTWGRRDGDQRNRRLAPTFEKMQMLLGAGYRQAGREAKATVVPVGDVWWAIRRENLGLAKRMYQADGSHPSQLGAYVTALTVTCHLFDRQPKDLPVPQTVQLTEKELQLIRAAVTKSKD